MQGAGHSPPAVHACRSCGAGRDMPGNVALFFLFHYCVIPVLCLSHSRVEGPCLPCFCDPVQPVHVIYHLWQLLVARLWGQQDRLWGQQDWWRGFGASRTCQQHAGWAACS